MSIQRKHYTVGRGPRIGAYFRKEIMSPKRKRGYYSLQMLEGGSIMRRCGCHCSMVKECPKMETLEPIREFPRENLESSTREKKMVPKHPRGAPLQVTKWGACQKVVSFSCWSSKSSMRSVSGSSACPLGSVVAKLLIFRRDKGGLLIRRKLSAPLERSVRALKMSFRL